MLGFGTVLDLPAEPGVREDEPRDRRAGRSRAILIVGIEEALLIMPFGERAEMSGGDQVVARVELDQNWLGVVGGQEQNRRILVVWVGLRPILDRQPDVGRPASQSTVEGFGRG